MSVSTLRTHSDMSATIGARAEDTRLVEMATPRLESDHMPRKQFLVRFRNETFVINVGSQRECAIDITCLFLLQELSNKTGWPVSRLVLTNLSFPWVSVSVKSCVLGGKGGFGTLLKGQSKQAGANMTTDFGACRDLQGRRLRHVNDEIKLRKWRELQQLKQSGEEVDEIAYMQTPSGILNWHLMVPNWASDSLSKKGTSRLRRKWQRQMKDIKSREEEARLKKLTKDEEQQQIVSDYVRRSTEASNAMQENIADAIRQGMKQQKQDSSSRKAAVKRKRQHSEKMDRPTDDSHSQPQSLCTLSGDAVVVESSSDAGTSSSFQIQSKSDFCTVALVLDGEITQPDKGLWFETKIVSGGLAQVGWAAFAEQGFSPNNDTGDGVGDDACSFAYDGSRSMKFHNGTEVAYGDVRWEVGDVIGCRYDPASGEISYSCNGRDLGVAFRTTPNRTLVPAMSCNQGEILELSVKEEDMQQTPSDCVPVYNLLSSSLLDDSSETVEKSLDSEDKQQLTKEENGDVSSKKTQSEQDSSTRPGKQLKESKAPPKKQQEPAPKPLVEAKPLHLDEFQSVEELKELGLDRLKGALMALGVKCGGSLQERAERLFSLKGLKREDYPTKVRGKSFVL